MGGDVFGDIAMAEEFCQFFANCDTCNPNVRGQPTTTAWTRISCQFGLKCIGEQITSGLLKQLKTRKATGISSRLLKLTAPGVARSLTQLFNYSLKTGEIPSEWKSANITPVLKKGRKEDVNNYRPISVLPIVAKVFERIVHKQLYEYLERNHILHPDQSGYRPKHSTLDALLKAIDYWRRALDSNELVGAVFIDLSKAFDSIDHELLLSKLESYGIQDIQSPLVQKLSDWKKTESAS